MKAYTVIENGIKKYKIVNQKFNGQGVYYTPKDLVIDKSFSPQLLPLQKIGTVRVVNWCAYNFNASSYIKVANCVPSGDKEFQVAFVFKEGVSQQGICEIKTNNIAFSIETHDTSLYYYVTYNGSTTAYSGVNTLVDGDYCVLTCSFEGAWFRAYLSQNSGSFVQERFIADDNNKLVRGDFILGTNLISDHYFTGAIDLNHTYVKQNNSYFFRGDMPYGLKQFGILSNGYIIEKGPIDYTVVGNPTIENGILSNTSTGDCIKISNFPMRSKNNWQLDIKAATVFNNNQQRAVYFPSGYLRVIGTTPAWNLYIDGQEFGLGEIHLYPYARVVRENNTIYAYDSTDGINYNLRGTITNANLSDGDLMLGGGSGQPWVGTIDLNFTSIKLNGWAWFGSANLIWANPNIYLQSSGQQYINTTYKATHESKIKINAAMLGRAPISDESFSTLFGARTLGSIYNNFFLFLYAPYAEEYQHQRSINYWFGNRLAYYTASTNIEFGEKFSAELDKTGYTFNGNKIISFTSYSEFETENCGIFSYQNGGGKSKAKIYNLQVFTSNIINYNFVPVPQGLKIGNFTVPSNGMYDMVEQKFYPNAGTGEFVYGRD